MSGRGTHRKAPEPGPIGRLFGELAKFGTVGALGIVVNFLFFNLFTTAFGLATLRANTLATVLAAGANYLGYRYWVYRDESSANRTREILLFVLFSAVGLSIEDGLLAATHYMLDLRGSAADNMSKFAGLCLGTAFRFVSYRLWVFQGVPQSQRAPGRTSVY